jgi:hypothetical protein
VQELLALAESADQAALPDEIKRRQVRWLAMDAAKAKIEARARVRFEQDQAACQERLAKRAARTAETGKKPGGKPPKAAVEGPTEHDQINLTDEDSRIMRVAGGGFEQCYNAQAAVDADSLLVVTQGLTQAGNDKQQVVPMLAELKALPASLGQVQALVDTTVNTTSSRAGQPESNLTWRWRAKTTTPTGRCVSRSRHRTALMPAPSNGWRTSSRVSRDAASMRCVNRRWSRCSASSNRSWAFRQFLLRGMDKVSGEWRLVCLAWNLKRMAVLRHKSVSCR